MPGGVNCQPPRDMVGGKPPQWHAPAGRAETTGPTSRYAAMIARALCAAAAVLALAACNVSGTGRAGLPGEPLVPSAASPTGSAGGTASGGGVPLPTAPGGAGGVGSGNQPGRAGTR